ncbi:sensor histidine kinase [Fervidibacillus halotolerans]|uniref:histidine kinase n=1 Tax=Fervidibacillus halotolerans TaxID=2980027 RepID=A0A9E8S0E8_9BACI|nr:sensor histidine kinase [Fervidibacillus halotolerans]WAA12527.1 sensor histidine kinase [Fervidibacillus halotolerans]
MKTIRSKLITYFFVFVFIFNIVSIAIFFSSNQLMKEYNSSFERFLLLNSISQRTVEITDKVTRFVVERDSVYVVDFHKIRKKLENEASSLEKSMPEIDKFQIQKYENMIETLIEQGELAIGFAIRDDIDQYHFYLEEVQNTASYLKETTLDLIDLELTEYQFFYQQLNERNQSFQKFIISLFSTSVLLAIFFSLWFSKELNEPIQALTSMAQEVSKGNFNGEPVRIQSNDEMKILAETFNRMRTNIRELIEEIKEKSEQEKLLKELELKHLQNQINPHFLFNTLNTISRMAFLENANQTTKLIGSVSSLLRYSLGDLNQSVTLKEEVHSVENYFYIQSTRFFDRIAFKTDIEEKCLDLPIPRLILQPLVENAFIHGVEGKEDGGEIQLSVYEFEELIIVEVKDNGIGMDEEKVQKYLNMDFEGNENHAGHTTGLGLENVIKRLKLFYDRKDIVDIISKPHQGTTVRLLLPKKYEKKFVAFI